MLRWMRPTAAVLLLATLGWALPLPASACDVVGTLSGLAVGGTRVGDTDVQHLSVERGNQTLPGANGMPLCNDDRLTTHADATAILRLGPAEGPQHDITLRANTSVQVRGPSAIALLLGRVFAALGGHFDVLMGFGTLAATGTEFDLAVTAQGLEVAQLEGGTRFTPADAAAPAPAPVSRLNTFAYQPGAAGTVIGFPAGRCEALTNDQSDMLIRTRPAWPSGNRAGVYTTGPVAAAFADARRSAVCDDAAAAREILGRIYVDWEQPLQALRLLAMPPVSPTDQELAAYRTARGQALRMQGQTLDALEQFQAVVAGATPPAGAYNGLGDAHRDLALTAIAGNHGPEALPHFEQAALAYRSAFDRAGSDAERSVALVNQGELQLLRTSLDAAEAESRLTEAQSLFERARTFGDPPHARLGLARIEILRAQLIPTQQMDATGESFLSVLLANIALAFQAEQQRRPHREAARQLLEALVAAAPGFAPAQEALGEVFAQLNRRQDARAHLLQAIAADPGYASAYAAYANVASGDRKELYTAAYKTTEVAPVREQLKARRTLLAPSPATVTIPGAPLTVDATELSFVAPPWTHGQVLTLTNRGNAPVTADSIAITGPGAAAFRIVQNTCAGTSVAPQQQCQIGIAFRVETVGSYQATLQVTGGGGQWTRTVELRGRFRAAAATPP